MQTRCRAKSSKFDFVRILKKIPEICLRYQQIVFPNLAPDNSFLLLGGCCISFGIWHTKKKNTDPESFRVCTSNSREKGKAIAHVFLVFVGTIGIETQTHTLELFELDTLQLLEFMTLIGIHVLDQNMARKRFHSSLLTACRRAGACDLLVTCL
jgi:hypothetical protein